MVLSTSSKLPFHSFSVVGKSCQRAGTFFVCLNPWLSLFFFRSARKPEPFPFLPDEKCPSLFAKSEDKGFSFSLLTIDICPFPRGFSCFYENKLPQMSFSEAALFLNGAGRRGKLPFFDRRVPQPPPLFPLSGSGWGGEAAPFLLGSF